MNISQKDVGAKNFARIAELGGFGKVGDGQDQLSADRNLDLTGVLDDGNKAVSDEARAEIKSILAAKKVEEPAEAPDAKKK